MFLAIDHMVETTPQNLIEPFRNFDVGKMPLPLDDGQSRAFDTFGHLIREFDRRHEIVISGNDVGRCGYL